MEPVEIKKILHEQYGFDVLEIISVRESSDNFIYKIVTSDNAYVARISRRLELQEADLVFEIQLMQKSSEAGLRVPKIISTRDKKSFVINKGIYIVLFEFVNGEHLELSINAPPTLVATYNAGKELGRLHSTWNTFEIPVEKTRTMYTEFERFLSHADFFSATFINGEEVIDLAKSILHKIKSYSDEDSFIHNDFRPHNIFFDPKTQEVTSVLDFDWSCRGSQMKDLAHSIVEWSFRDGTLHPHLDVAQSFLDGYLHARNVEIDLRKLKNWMVFSCISDALTYWMDRKDALIPGTELSSYMYSKGMRALQGDYDSIVCTML